MRKPVKALLVNGRVECVSCHMTHEEATELRFRLRMTENDLCLSCHAVE